MKADKTDMLVRQVLSDSGNDLAEMIRSFQEAGEPVWYIDRHVLEPSRSARIDPALPIAACSAGFALLRQWMEQRKAFHANGIMISEPYLVIDDEWLAARPHAPPPHVYLCLGADENKAVWSEPPADPFPHDPLPDFILRLLAGDETFYRIAGAFDDEPGTAWLFKIQGSV